MTASAHIFPCGGLLFFKCQKVGRWGLGVIGDVFFFNLAKVLDWESILGTLGDALTTTVSTELDTENRERMVGV